MNPLTRFLIGLSVVLITSRVLGRVLAKLNQPAVMGSVLAGIVLGPSLVGGLFPELLQSLFLGDLQIVWNMTGQLGVIFFMFTVGLEFNYKYFAGQTRQVWLISLGGMALPFLCGLGLAFFLWPDYGQASFPVFAMFLGVALAITAFPVLAKILSDLDLKRTSVGTLALACAAIDDVCAWCLLALLASLARHGTFAWGVLTTLSAAAFLLLAWKFVRPQLRGIAQRIQGLGSEDRCEPVLFKLMLALFAFALLTELIGIHAIFGAFLLGVLFAASGYEGLHKQAEPLLAVPKLVFLPLFFALAGLKTKITLISSWQDVVCCLGIIVVATLGKWGGVTFLARMCKIEKRDAAALGVLMNTRGLVELIVLNLGLELGIVGQKLYTMMVLMALATTLMTVPLFRMYSARRGLLLSG